MTQTATQGGAGFIMPRLGGAAFADESSTDVALTAAGVPVAVGADGTPQVITQAGAMAPGMGHNGGPSMDGGMGVAEQNKRIADLMGLSPRMLSVVASNRRSRETRHNLWRNFSANNRPVMLPYNQLDILEVMDTGDDCAIPSVFTGCCDPAVPLIPRDDELAVLTTISTPYIKRKFEIVDCDDNLIRAAIQDFGRSPYNRGPINERSKMNMQLNYGMTELEREILEAEVRMFNNSLLYGKFRIAGPGIPVDKELVDLCRDRNLTIKLAGDGWCNPAAAIRETLIMMNRHLHDYSGVHSFATDVIFDEVAEQKFWASIEMQECARCARYDGRIVDEFSANRTPRHLLAHRGLRRLPYDDGVNGVRYWVLDEKQKVAETDANGLPTGRIIEQPIMPPGSVLFLNANDIAPISIYGKIKNLMVLEPRRRWAQTRMINGGECLEYRVHTSPLHFIRRVNSAMLAFIAPETCPPPCWVNPVEFACDPEGGKKAAAAMVAHAIAMMGTGAAGRIINGGEASA
jgi:hypothetical protein